MKLSRKMLGIGSAVAVAGALAVTGISAAAASGSQPFVYVSIMTTNPANNAPSSIILRGSITDGGVDHPGNTVDTAVFPDGTFKIAHSPGTGTPNPNPRTCLVLFAVNGTYKLFGGTGAYAGISGHGIYRVNITFTAPKSPTGQCTRGKPVAFQQLIKAQGPVSGA
jgi:hypothetical protein